MDDWNQLGVLAHRQSLQKPLGLQVLCRLDRLDGRAAFPRMELNWLKPEKADVRFLIAEGQSLENTRTWQIEFTRLDSVVNWPEMLLKLTQEELRKARIEIAGIQRKRLELQSECDACMDVWMEAMWNLLTRRVGSSVQGEELHQGATAQAVIEAKTGCEKAPFWEWKHRDHPGQRSTSSVAEQLGRYCEHDEPKPPTWRSCALHAAHVHSQ